jgi:hypothetical protein
LGTNIVLGSGIHPDFTAFLNAPQTDNISYGIVGTNNVQGEGFFNQNYKFFDIAVVNSLFQPTNLGYNGYSAIYLQSPMTNGYFSGNTFTGTVAKAGAYAATDLFFTNNTCPAPYAGAITTTLGGAGVTITGGSC